MEVYFSIDIGGKVMEDNLLTGFSIIVVASLLGLWITLSSMMGWDIIGDRRNDEFTWGRFFISSLLTNFILDAFIGLVWMLGYMGNLVMDLFK